MTDPASLPPGLAARVPAGASVLAQAPGRANLIGEHTDYNQGFVLPVALGLRSVVVGRHGGTVIRLRSADEPGTVEIDPRTGAGPMTGWGRYATAVASVLVAAGFPLRPLDGLVVSTVPIGTGLSSSAALEVAVALALLEEPPNALTLARLCQRAENEGVGVQSGIMDQLVSAAAEPGAALLIDCRSLETTSVPVPGDLRILVVDSGDRRELSAGDYNARRVECEEAARRLGLRSLREVSDPAAVESLPQPLAARARHVVTENARTLAAADALRAADRARLGELFAASHASLAGDFAVSTPNLDALVAIAAETPGVIGARMTGGGFGGCTVSLVEADGAGRIAEKIASAYAERVGRRPGWWLSAPGPGAMALLQGGGAG